MEVIKTQLTNQVINAGEKQMWWFCVDRTTTILSPAFITLVYHLRFYHLHLSPGLSPAIISVSFWFITSFITCVYHLVYQNQYAACTLYTHCKSSDFHTPYTLVVYGPCINPV